MLYILNKKIYRPLCVESSALGAAYLAGLAVGYWNSRAEILENWETSKIFKPSMAQAIRDRKQAGWRAAVNCALYWGNMKKNETFPL